MPAKSAGEEFQHASVSLSLIRVYLKVFPFKAMAEVS
jgi:hypothetical protein